MSTEQKLVAVVDAANDLTKMIAAKIGDINLKVQQAVTVVPQAVRRAMDVALYVDAVAGNDANDGVSWATAVKTIAGAFARMTSGGRASIILKPGSVYSLAKDQVCDNKTISIQPSEFKAYDTSSYVELQTDSIIGEDDRVQSGGFHLGYNSVLVFYGCRLKTAKLSSALQGKGHDIWRTSFVKTHNSKSFVMLQHCAVELNNGAFMYQHTSGSIGVADLFMRNVLLDKVSVSTLPIATGYQFLMGSYHNVSVPFSLYGIEMVRQGAPTWAGLISQDMSNALTNLKD
ncbi:MULTISPECIES: hypothetical protein [Pseudomonas]|uniref:hypothetical protein n=1 Tax=Pseudomonas TaxID=286 RepID=UPI0016443A20|nr:MULTISPECIES: hypothetical protein [Pseudomonas]MBJ2242090.1 hypothetical protein [Pseudomonas sp. MF6768]QXH88321.1 hypothetical protein HU773_022115 [Pseudomonas shahriarae]